jgi:hypothetical protein
MSFNIKKCMVMHFGLKNPKYTYSMNGERLLTTKDERYIGVLVINNLKPSVQCAKAARTASVVLGQPTRAFHYRDRKKFVALYKQYVLPNCPSVESLVRKKQGSTGKGAAESHQHGIWPQGQQLRGEIKRAEYDNPGRMAPPGRHGASVQNPSRS